MVICSDRLRSMYSVYRMLCAPENKVKKLGDKLTSIRMRIRIRTGARDAEERACVCTYLDLLYVCLCFGSCRVRAAVTDQRHEHCLS
jgi:hypothetical protein